MVRPSLDLKQIGKRVSLNETKKWPTTDDIGISSWKYQFSYFPDSTRRGDVEAGRQQSDSSSTSFLLCSA